MKKNLLLYILVFVFIASCTKITNTEVGNGLIPPIDGVNTAETTLNVNTFNIDLESFRVSKYQDMVLGKIENDPVFGKTQAIINAEFKPPYFPYFYEVSNKIDATTGKDSLFLDSVVLVLSYKGIYGDSTKPVSFKVYEISQTSPLRADSIYQTKSVFNTATQIGSATNLDPKTFNDSVHAFREEAANQIRIKLTNSFGNRLLKEFDSTNVYSSDAQFSSTFRGISVVPQMGSGFANNLVRISLQDTNTKVSLYYRYTRRDTKEDTVVRYFRAGAITSGAANNIVRTIAGSESNNNLTNAISVEESSLYLQAGQGNFVRIKTPGINTLSNRIVHRAELLMEQDYVPNSIDTVYKPPFLFLAAIPKDRDDSLSNRFYIPYDISVGQGGSVSNLATFGGSPINKIDVSGNTVATYSFNITRYVQSIITRKESVFDLYLFAPVNDYIYTSYNSSLQNLIYPSPLNYPSYGRVKLFGGNTTQTAKRMRLHIVYSNL